MPSPALKRRLLFSGLSLLVFLLLLEVGARLFWSPPGPDDGKEMAPHPTRGWELQDKASSAGVQFQLGEHGLRRVPLTGAPHRILTTGDSSIFGHGLRDADTLHMNLHRALKERGKAVDVLTAGVPGYTSAQTLDQMERFGWGMNPDALVVGNLWSDSDFESSPDPDWEGQPGPSGLRRHSRALQMLEVALGGGPKQGDWGTAEGPEGERRIELTDYESNLGQLFKGASQRGITALLLLPCNRELADGAPTPPKGWPWTPYFEAARRQANAHSVPLIEGCAVAMEKGLRGEAAFLDEMHPTAPLNEAYAVAIADRLLEMGWPEGGQ